MATTGKPVMVVGIDQSDLSFYALEWTLNHFFPPGSPHQFKLLLVHALPIPSSLVGVSGPGTGDCMSRLESDLKRLATRTIHKGIEICKDKSVGSVETEILEGDARNALCEAVDKYHADILVVGSHGYGALKRAILGSVSDYCVHHAHCSVMVVKRPKQKHSHSFK